MLEAGGIALFQQVDIIAVRFGVFEKARIRQDHRAGDIGCEGSIGDALGGWRRQARVIGMAGDRVRKGQFSQQAGQLKSARARRNGPLKPHGFLVGIKSEMGREAVAAGAHSGRGFDPDGEAARQKLRQAGLVKAAASLHFIPKIMRRTLQLGEIVVLANDQIVHLTHRRGGAPHRSGLIEIADQRSGEIGQIARFAVDRIEETVLVRSVEVGHALQDFGAGAHRGDMAQNLMQQIGQQRIGVQPIARRPQRSCWRRYSRDTAG